MNKFKLIKIDETGRRLKENSEVKGVEYVMAYLQPKPGSYQAKNGEKRRVILKRPDGTMKPAREFEYDNSRRKRSGSAIRKLINQAIDQLTESEGYDPEKTALENAASIREEKRRITAVFQNFMTEYRLTPVKRTLKKRSEKTVAEMQNAFGWYVRIFSNHTIDHFPKDVSEKFQLLLATKSARPGSKKTMSPSNIRKHGIALHQFFDWMANKGLIQKTIKLDLPSQTLTPAPVPFTPEQLNRVTEEIQGKIQDAELKPGKRNRRLSEADLFKNHLRAWLMMVHCGLRLAEVWSLRVENILVDQGAVHIPGEIDMDGGLDRYGKPFQVEFTSKSGVAEDCGIGTIARKFVEWDLADRDAGWFLQRADGSNAFSSPEALGKAIERHQKSAGVSGAKRCQGVRIAVATSMGEENIYLAQQQLRHKDVSTTLRSYAAKTPDAVKNALDRVSNLHTGIVN